MLRTAPIAVIASVVLLGSLFALVYVHDTSPKLSQADRDGTYRMVLKEDGYHPQELVIKKGSTVVFSTDRGRHHWPASNMHPNHGIYPAFDPGEPIPPDTSWSFRFDRIGTWNLHDHLRSYYRGSIQVIE